MNIKAYANADTNHYWVVEVDGVQIARFEPDQVFLAAGYANQLRLYGNQPDLP